MSNQDTRGSGPLDLNLLRTFLAVHRLGSFTAAARRLGLSQSTVTTQIRTLENHLGRELFERRARGVTPLPHAHELATQLSVPMDQLAGITGEGPSDSPAPVHLVGPAEFLSGAGLKVLAPLVAQGVQLRMAIGLTEPLLEELRAGRHDLVVATRRLSGRTLHAELLADEEFVLVAAPAWAERLKGQELPTALEGIPLIAYAEDLPIARRYWRQSSTSACMPRPRSPSPTCAASSPPSPPAPAGASCQATCVAPNSPPASCNCCTSRRIHRSTPPTSCSARAVPPTHT